MSDGEYIVNKSEGMLLSPDEEYMMKLTAALQSLCLMTGKIAIHDLLQEDYEKWMNSKIK